MRKPMLTMLIAGMALSALAAKVDYFKPGERAVFFGDSITHGGSYVAYLQLFENLRHPGSGVRIMNCGVSGDTTAGGISRYDWDALGMKPDRVFVMFGMNDVNRYAWATEKPSDAQRESRERALKNYAENQAKLADLLEKSGVTTVLITPTPYNQYSTMPTNENLVCCNEPGLAECAKIVRELAKKRDLGLVEFHAPLTKLAKSRPDYTFCRDRVHPAGEGHLLMAAKILTTMGVSPIVEHSEFKAQTPNRAEFEYAPKAMPFPKLAEYENDLQFANLTERLNREELVVTGLAEGRYALAFNGEKVGEFTAGEFAEGVNIALLDTPNQLLAREAAKVAMKLRDHLGHYRNYPLMVMMLRNAKVNPDDRAAADAYIDAWLAKNEKSQYISSFRHWADVYRKLRDDVGNQLAKEEELRSRLAAVRPVSAKVTVSRIGGK